MANRDLREKLNARHRGEIRIEQRGDARQILESRKRNRSAIEAVMALPRNPAAVRSYIGMYDQLERVYDREERDAVRDRICPPGELRDLFIMEREYHRVDSGELYYRQLPLLRDPVSLIKSLDTNDDNIHDSIVRVFYEGVKFQQDDLDFLNCLMMNVFDYGIISFDTENNNATELVVNFGSIHGYCAIFKNFDDVPRVFWDMLENPYIYKIGSGIKNDIDLLLEKGVRVSSFVDTCRYFLTFVRPDVEDDRILSMRNQQPGSGTKVQAAVMGLASYPFRVQVGNRQRNSNFLPGFRRPFGTHEIKHMAHDLRIPFALLLFSVYQIEKQLPEPQIMTGIHYRLACLMSLYPPQVTFRIPRREPVLFPVPRQDSEDIAEEKTCTYIGSELIHSLHTVQRIMKMSLYFEKYYPTKFCAVEPRLRAEVAIAHWGGNVVLPKSDECSKSWRSFNNVCRNCASQAHTIAECPEVYIPCQYPLCDSWNRDKHSMLTCHALDNFCSKCCRRGHMKSVHNAYLLPQLESCFLAHCHRGLYTCIPFLLLSSNEEDRAKVQEWHFKTSLYGNSSIAAKKVSAQLDLPWNDSLRSERKVPALTFRGGQGSPARAHLFPANSLDNSTPTPRSPSRRSSRRSSSTSRSPSRRSSRRSPSTSRESTSHPNANTGKIYKVEID